VNYTREPIIETVITPKEGCKLVIRNSKGVGQEEYFVEAIEIVNFGNAIFFRSTERPKSFLVPVSDYEVIELKETKMILKSTGMDKSIKIGSQEEDYAKTQRRKKMMKKSKIQPPPIKPPQTSREEMGSDVDDETQVSSSILRQLFPPPPNLIKEKLNHFKSHEKSDEGVSEKVAKEDELSKKLDEKIKEEEPMESEEKKDK